MAENKSSSVEDAELIEDTDAEKPEAVQSSTQADTPEGENDPDTRADDADEPHEDEPEETHEDPHDEHPEDHVDEHDDHYGEERGMSFAGRVLWFLAILAAGGALALWGGPKLAPLLPAPLSPVAKYLTPGANQVETALDELRNETDARFKALPDPVDREAIDAAIANVQNETSALVSARADAIAADVAALGDKVAASDSAEVEARLSTLETQLSGLTAEFASLQSALGELETSDGSASELSAEMSAKIAGYAASLEGLKAELAAVSAQNGTISQRIDEVEAATNRRVSEADARAEESKQAALSVAQAKEIELALEQIEDGLNAGQAYAGELESVASLVDVEIPDALSKYASAGVASIASLKSTFSNAASNGIRSAIRADAEDGTISGFSAFLKSQVVTRSLTPQEGDSTDAILSRMDASLAENDLASALDEASKLSEPVANAMSDWLTKARSRAEALSGFDALKAALAARS